MNAPLLVRRTLLGWVACALLAASAADAHRLAPSYLDLQETAPERFDVTWKTPRMVARGARVEPVLPPSCRPESDATLAAEATAWVQQWQIRCTGGIVGATLAVTGLAESGTDALVNVRFGDGRTLRNILTADSPSLVVPEQESRSEVMVDYGRLGIDHLLTGWDHVLFVVGLLLLVGRGRRLVGAITAFTVGHSLTLALAALGLVRVPQDVVEVGIALSIVVLAAELLQPSGAPPRFLARRPWFMSFGFGLLHGLGFAGALAELGLPQHAIPLALFSFNVGIELGQLAIVALALPVGWLFARLATPPPWLVELPATAIGSLGAFWCLDRAAGLVGF